ncbi:MAG: dienelactone hydrolase family protein [Proteobacteria bacterium]|nr:dienelactone hydrolase family protein [Pseudomonadota bacterium]
MTPTQDPPNAGDAGRATRRELVLGALAAGFALAVRPVSATTIVTGSDGLVAGPVAIPAADGTRIAGYRARPQADPGRAPVVLVVPEIFGVHEHIRDVCRRLARRGYCAVAPELFARQGDVAALSDVAQIIAEVVSKVPDEQVLADLDATLAWAQAEHEGDVARAAVTGFCWGGRITWLYAAHRPALKAAVAWYGRLAGAPSALQPRHPLDVAATLTVPVLGLYGGQDAGIPLESVERMRAALAAGRSGSQIVVYPDAPHAFHADYRPSYREAAAKDGWERLLAWLGAHGAAPSG